MYQLNLVHKMYAHKNNVLIKLMIFSAPILPLTKLVKILKVRNSENGPTQ